MAPRRERTVRLLAVRPAPRHPPERTGRAGQGTLADRVRLPRTQARPGPGPLRGPLLDRLAPPRHVDRCRPAVPDLASPDQPKSPWADLSLYALLRELQYLLATWLGFCPLCHALVPP